SRLRLALVLRFVADAARARAVEHRAVPRRRPRARAAGTRVAHGAELAVVTALPLVRGLGLARVGPFVADADRARSVQARAVVLRRSRARAAVAHVAVGAELAVVAALALVGRLGLTIVSVFVADADGALPVVGGAVGYR